MGFLDRFFSKAEIPASVKDTLADLAAKGEVVFVMRSAGWLNLSFVRWLARHLGLHALGAAVGMGRRIRLLLGRRGTVRALAGAVAARAPALIFLRRPSVWRAKGTIGAAIAGKDDPFALLVDLQRAHARPIYLVPMLYVWSRRPQRIKPSLIDIVLGSTEAPGILATSLSFLRNYGRAFVRMGAPIDLGAFLASQTADTAGALVPRKVRGALYYHLSREARAVLGPPFKEQARGREEVLRDRALQDALASIAQDSGRAPEDVARDAARIVREVAARLSPLAFEILRPIVRWMCNRLYQGIELDEAGLAEVRQAANQGGLVLCPSHKSHMDYVILSYLFYENGLLPPHVAAGINLAFWPFGPVARWAGGFFIRRSFKGDRLYGAVLRAYVKRLLRDGFPQEFFIEGGRSRTGKLAFPKTGLLAMEVDAWRDSTVDDVFFVPVAIDYEKLPEGRSYTSELRGATKRKESFWSLLGARKILRARHGRIYIQFNRPISLKAVAAERTTTGSGTGERQDDDESQHRAFVQGLANRIAYGISRASTITPVGLAAVALLADTGEVPAERVAARIALLRQLADVQGCRLSRSLIGPSTADPIAEALAMLIRDGVVQARGSAGYAVPPQRRAELDFYRNNVIHHFIPYAIIAATMIARPAAAGQDGVAAPTRGIEQDARWLSRLLKLEFIYRAGTRFEAIFAETHAAMVRLGLTAPDAEEGIAFLAEMVRPLLDAYRAAAATLGGWSGGDQRSFVAAALERAREEAATGGALPESVSKTTLENAVAWLAAENAFEPSPEGSDRLLVSPPWRAGRARQLLVDIDRFRRRDAANEIR